jgi:hypothetical protein
MAGRTRGIAAVPARSARKRPGLAGQVQETLDALPLTSADAATGELARAYGRVLDQGADLPLAEQQRALAELGPKLLAVLIELGGTPRARAKDRAPAQGPSRLAALRGELA